MKKAFVTGISGQDGSYLAELLLSKGYAVYGLVRREAIENQGIRLARISHIIDDIQLIVGTVDSFPSIYKAIAQVKPDEVYHLAAQSFVSYDFDDEYSTIQSNINGTHHVLAAMKDFVPNAKLYFAASSEMFGRATCSPQDENTHFHPRSSYGISKVAGYHLSQNYRNSYGMFTCSGILYNHESPRRGRQFVTRKITSHAVQIKLGLKSSLELGCLNARRDWGHAKDYVRAMWIMLQHDVPDDYVVCTGQTHSVRELCDAAFSVLDLNYEDYVTVNPQFVRAPEEFQLVGDNSKAKDILNWEPTISFEELVQEMVEADMKYYEGLN